MDYVKWYRGIRRYPPSTALLFYQMRGLEKLIDPAGKEVAASLDASH